MKKLINDYQKKYGYTPTIWELHILYTQGELILTDKQENKLLEYFKNNGIN